MNMHEARGPARQPPRRAVCLPTAGRGLTTPNYTLTSLHEIKILLTLRILCLIFP